jgi:hypothetical protein
MITPVVVAVGLTGAIMCVTASGNATITALSSETIHASYVVTGGDADALSGAATMA